MNSSEACTPFPEKEFIRSRLTDRPRRMQTRDGFRRAAVLIPLLPVDGDWDVLLTRRTSDLPHHRGQIAFPGGSVDAGENCEMAALREAEEEIGLVRSRVEILGCHDDIVTPSGFVIAPVLGIVDGRDGLEANPAEVSRIFFTPLSFFSDEGNAEVKYLPYEGREREVHFYRYDGETIWGATALILRNILQLFGQIEN
jgi:8-oxo-dGTP pyrophosphatase MutT (NUDIX family)